jgi:Protein of unknown function, DUF547
LYEIRESDSVTGKQLDKHYKSETINIVKLEMCNSVHCSIGPATKKWKLHHKKTRKCQRELQNIESSSKALVDQRQEENLEDVAASEYIEEENNIAEHKEHDGQVNSEMSTNDVPEDTERTFETNGSNENPNLTSAMDDETENAAEELGEGIYVRSGDTIALRESANMQDCAIYANSNDLMMFEDESEPAIPTLLSSAPTDMPQQLSSSRHYYVTHAGGFAVLQENTPRAIIIEKAGKSARWGKNKSKLIKCGDTVVFKMVGRGDKDGNKEPVKYLSIHRGWWLKWVSSVPTKNGYFTIHTTEEETNNCGEGPAEIQSSYLTLGGEFYLRHKRWSKCLVGISAEGSTAYGGRMLGLHVQPKHGGRSNLGEFPINFDDGDLETDPIPPVDDGKLGSKRNWIRSMLFQAFEMPTSPSSQLAGIDIKDTKNGLSDSFELDPSNSSRVLVHGQYNMDVPAWIEIMNRTTRVRQHTYVVRVLPCANSAPNNSTDIEFHHQNKPSNPSDVVFAPFIRLRTGRDLAQIMRTGMKWRNCATSPRRAKPMIPAPNSRSTTISLLSPSPSVRLNIPSSPHGGISGNLRARSLSTPNIVELTKSPSFHSFDELDCMFKEEDKAPRLDILGLIDHGKKEVDDSESNSELESSEGSVEAEDEINQSQLKHGKGRKLLGKVAKAVKSTAASTGRTVVRKTTSTGKNVVLGTVNVGKSILPIRPKNPPMKEPVSVVKRQTTKQREKDLNLDVRSRSMKRIELLEARSSQGGPAAVLAGELSAPEQSCRTVSNMLSIMSTESSYLSTDVGFSTLLSSLVERISEQDKCFLVGGALQLGVAPSKIYSAGKGALLHDCVVARCIWESHWREEWCGLYEDGVAFFAPLTQLPSIEVPFSDIKIIRFLEPNEISSLPGYPLLVIETAWICHCFAFLNVDTRNDFYRRIEKAKKSAADTKRLDDSLSSHELEEAHFWQGFQNSLDFSLILGSGKWAKVQCGSKAKSRVVLNNRRLTTDISPVKKDTNQFIEELLETALCLSLNSLKKCPDDLISFLDASSQLRILSLDDIDRSSREGFCVFVNLYHCLLQHALLFSVNGPLNKQSWLSFMRTSCYEIGRDVFSLAELHSCVIRGNMSRAVAAKIPFVDAPKKSNAYRYYSLGYLNPCTNFFLNSASASCVRAVPILTPTNLDEQLKHQAREFLRISVTVDPTKKLVILPKIFDVYKTDFITEEKGSVCSAMSFLQFSLPYLCDDVSTAIRKLMQEDITIKYSQGSEQFHLSLEPVCLTELI